VLGVFLFYPIVQTIIFSLHDLQYSMEWRQAEFVGLSNYMEALQSRNFWFSLRFTLYFTIVSVSLELLIGLGLALATFWVYSSWRGILRAIILLPWAVPPVIHAAMWKWLYNSDAGMFGDLLVRSGLVERPPGFLVEPFLAMNAVVMADVWKTSSVMAIFLTAGLAAIPQDIYDAAQTDGARAWLRFRTITLPMLAPTIIVAVLFRSMDALRVFDIVYGLTGGGPGNMTETLSSFAYKFYFRYSNFGMGSTFAIVVFAFVLFLSYLYIRRVRTSFRFRG
jgi:ABC-type sugar transport system permease subunit